MSSCKILQWCQKVFHEKKQQQRTSKASSSFCSKQTIQIFVHFSVTQIHHIIFFQALLLLFFTFSVFSKKKKKSLLALSLATSFFFPPYYFYYLEFNFLWTWYCYTVFFLSLFFWEEMLTQKWQRMKSKMMLLIHLLLFLPCRSRHLSFWKKLYVIGPLGLSSIEMKNCNEKLLPIYVLTWKNKDRLAVYVVVHFLLHKKWTLHCF